MTNKLLSPRICFKTLRAVAAAPAASGSISLSRLEVRRAGRPKISATVVTFAGQRPRKMGGTSRASSSTRHFHFALNANEQADPRWTGKRS